MKPLIIFFAFLTATAHANSFVNEKSRYDEGTLFAPPFNNSGVDRQLTDLMDSKGNSQLCAPVAISHAFEFLKKYRNPAFPLLPTVHDVDGDGVADTFKDRIRYFFQTLIPLISATVLENYRQLEFPYYPFLLVSAIDAFLFFIANYFLLKMTKESLT